MLAATCPAQLLLPARVMEKTSSRVIQQENRMAARPIKTDPKLASSGPAAARVPLSQSSVNVPATPASSAAANSAKAPK